MEMKVLHYLPDGLKRWEIAEKLNLSVHTVNFHLKNASRKLGVHNEAEAAANLIKEGILSPEQTFVSGNQKPPF